MKNSRILAEKLKYFIDDPNLACIMGQNARKKCEKEYSERRHFHELIPVLLDK